MIFPHFGFVEFEEGFADQHALAAGEDTVSVMRFLLGGTWCSTELSIANRSALD